MQRLDSVNKKIDLATTNIEINTLVEDFVCSLLDSEFCSLWFYDQEKAMLLRERDNNMQRELPFNLKKGIIYKCFMNKKSTIYNYLASDKDYVAEIDNPDAIKIKSKIIVPLLDGDTLIGIVTVYSSIKKPKKYTRSNQNLLETLTPFLINTLCKMHSLKICTTSSNISKTMKNFEQKQDEKSVESSNQTLRTMANFIHDIRTPANTLQGFLELLETQIEDKRLKEYLVNAKESANFINELTTSMLEHIKFQQEDKMTKVVTLEGMKFFADIANGFISNMNAKNIAFNTFIDPLLPKTIIIDEMMIKRVLMNLLSNAYKFTPYGKKIDFSVRYDVDAKKVSISIKDEGIGIAKEKQEEIFEAFKQAEDMTSLQYGGTGLGLAICSKYVSDLGGELKIKSKLEKGTVFYFDIPIKSEDYKPSIEPIKNSNVKITILMRAKNHFNMMNIVRNMVRMGVQKENISLASKVEEMPKNVTNLVIFQNMIDSDAEKMMRDKKVLIIEEELFSIKNDELLQMCDVVSLYGNMAHQIYKFINIEKIPKVLIADDDKTSVVLLEKILENEYCEIDSVDNGKIALEMLIDSYKKQNPYSIVYIDNHMPFMTGKEVMKNLREFEKDNGLYPIYAVSTSGNVVDVKSENGKDFNLYVGKPFKIDEIRKALSY